MKTHFPQKISLLILYILVSINSCRCTISDYIPNYQLIRFIQCFATGFYLFSLIINTFLFLHINKIIYLFPTAHMRKIIKSYMNWTDFYIQWKRKCSFNKWFWPFPLLFFLFLSQSIYLWLIKILDA